MYSPDSAYLELLKDRIRPDRVAWSDRGSRVLVFRHSSDKDAPCHSSDEHALCIKLAERLTSLERGLSVHRKRQPYCPTLQFVDENGAPLSFKLTTYPHALVCETQIGEFVIVFQDHETLSIGLPNGIPAGVRFTVLPDLIRTNPCGGEFKSVRNCGYATNGMILRNDIINLDKGFEVIIVAKGNSDTAITLHIEAGLDLERQVVPFRQARAAAEQHWHDWFAQAPTVDEPYRCQYYYAWWVMGNNLLAPKGHLTRECAVPSKVHYIGAWQWDNAFHALPFGYIPGSLAEDQLKIMLDHQLPNGMIPDAVYDEDTITWLDFPVAAPVTKPPVLAWSAMHLFEQRGDLTLLKEVYEPIVRNNAWWFAHNDDDGDGIPQYNHPFSSGLDDNPLWESGMPVEAVCLSTYLCIQLEALGRMARLLGNDRDAQAWEARACALARRMVEHFYDADSGLFWSMKDHQRIDTLTPFSLYPLWTNRLSPALNDRLVGHLTDPDKFWTTYPLPTVALNDPKHNATQMWRGPVWININYIFVEALQRAGYIRQAQELTERTLRLVMSQNDIAEYYHPDTGIAPPMAAPMFGWSAACFIDLAIRQSRGAL